MIHTICFVNGVKHASERAVLVCSWKVAGIALSEVRWVEERAVLAGP